jgi:N-hydroxyarylamine O-acetyltransferase
MTVPFLELYFRRINYTGVPRADLATLRTLHLLHLQHIPYENIEVFCHQPVVIERAALVNKMLVRSRGGYCFEQNGLFAMVLDALGFDSHPNLARVHRNRPAPGGRTHQVNMVRLDGQLWLCDVGFGGSGFRDPLPLTPNVEVEQLGERYLLRPDSMHGFYLLKNVLGEWQPLYTFKLDPALPADIEIANFYTSNCPQYTFRNAIIGTRMTERGRVTLSDHTFKRFDLIDATVHTQTVTELASYISCLESELGVELTAVERERLNVHFARLKAPEAV